MTAPDFQALIASLSAAGVDYIIVGGVAAAMHASPYSTFDLDVVYDRSPVNLGRLVDALSPLTPYLRGAPPGLPFNLDVSTLERGLNFTLTTRAGDLDLLGKIAGGGTYPRLLPESMTVTLGVHGGVRATRTDGQGLTAK